ncbi:class I SAM-dependent RNA methyltransferase [Microbacterium sp. CJ88]|uniref:class I SAM-dependent RNA methyltransferase n=1 Tax=Microbacterium sp. CJ88 TaxID=3445672 RepID=UPI003F65B46A
MHSGDILDLDITDVAHGGVFVARHEGRVVFVPDAIPGERVRVRLTDVGKASFWRAEALEVRDASPHRRPHVWRQADIDVPPEQRPGGADFGHMELSHQRALKLEVVRDALTRIGRLEGVPATIEAASPARGADGEVVAEERADGTRWRTRVSLHVGADGEVGPFAARSHRVISVEDHPLATAAIERAALSRGGGAPGRIDLVQPADGSVRAIVRSDPTGPVRGRRRPPARPTDPRAAHDVVEERVGGRPFRVDAGGFWQVHRLAAATLTGAVTDALRSLPGGIDGDAAHLDLYGGVGLLAAAVGDVVGPGMRITSVESDARATEHAGENLAEWVGARAETARVDRFLKGALETASSAERERLSRGVVVLDPPRAGAGREVVDAVCGIRPAGVVYVACDPVALARDLAVFAGHGYAVHGDVRAIDLFPHSHHVEAVVALTR